MGDATPRKGELILCLLPFPEPADIIERIQKRHPHVEIVYRFVEYVSFAATTDAELVPEELFRKATILCTLQTLPPTPEAAPNLKFIHFFMAGIGHFSTHPIYTRSDIPLTTSSGIHGPMISEWVILQMLSVPHRQKKLLDWQKQHVWGRMEDLGPMRDAVGMRLGVLGYGSIGRQAARACKAVGMDVIAYTASPRPTPESKKTQAISFPAPATPNGTIPSAWYSGTDTSSLRNFLSQDIDVLLVSVPLTKQTEHFLGAPEFEILGSKRNAFVLNISRGGILKQDELITYLKKPLEEGGLKGAALDVTEPEPLGKDSELWDMENVVITPHISGLSVAYQDRAFQILEINLENLEKGRPLLNVVNRRKGY